jgi:hypothetical protein
MKTNIKISMVCAALMATTTVFAQTEAADSTINGKIDDNQPITKSNDRKSQSEPEWEEVVINHNGVTITKGHRNSDGSFSDDKEEYRVTISNEKTHVGAFDLGASGYGSKMFSTNIDDTASFLELNRGFHISFNICETRVPITQKHLGLATGIGLKFDIYSFSNKDMILTKGSTRLAYEFDKSTSYSKSKLRCTYLTVPLVLEWQQGNRDDLFLMAGVEGNLRIGSSTKTKTSSGDKEKHRTDLYMNRFSYNLVARAGIKGVGIFVKANMSPIFRDGKGPELYPFSAGICFTDWIPYRKWQQTTVTTKNNGTDI